MTALSDRQQQVLQLIADGVHLHEIAAMWGVDPQTVRKHAWMAYAKLEARNSAHAVAVAFRLGILTAERVAA